MKPALKRGAAAAALALVLAGGGRSRAPMGAGIAEANIRAEVPLYEFSPFLEGVRDPDLQTLLDRFIAEKSDNLSTPTVLVFGAQKKAQEVAREIRANVIVVYADIENRPEFTSLRGSPDKITVLRKSRPPLEITMEDAFHSLIHNVNRTLRNGKSPEISSYSFFERQEIAATRELMADVPETGIDPKERANLALNRFIEFVSDQNTRPVIVVYGDNPAASAIASSLPDDFNGPVVIDVDSWEIERRAPYRDRDGTVEINANGQKQIFRVGDVLHAPEGISGILSGRAVLLKPQFE